MQSHRIHIKGSAEHLEDATHCQLHVKWLPIAYPIDKPPHHEDRTIIASIIKKFFQVFFCILSTACSRSLKHSTFILSHGINSMRNFSY